MVVLINAYSGVLTSLLTVPKLEPIANTVKELVSSDELRFTTEKNAGYAIRFLVYNIYTRSKRHQKASKNKMLFTTRRLLRVEMKKSLAISYDKTQLFWSLIFLVPWKMLLTTNAPTLE